VIIKEFVSLHPAIEKDTANERVQFKGKEKKEKYFLVFSWRLKKSLYLCTPLNRIRGLFKSRISLESYLQRMKFIDVLRNKETAF
jgi:hypothetical protein